ncbi:MAG: Nif11-like leader peptide family natural product precursor [Lentisphaeria bacterium]|nr:Nif11-like leader peptide family natural product precursor [Lentisphaeria bacterium]
MSIENVAAFYLKLEKDPLLRAKAMDLKNHYPAQEELIGAFLRLAQEEGFSFTAQELAAYIYEKGTAENP